MQAAAAAEVKSEFFLEIWCCDVIWNKFSLQQNKCVLIKFI